MIVISSFYYGTNHDRHFEIVSAMIRNANNPLFSELHLFITTEDLEKLKKDNLLILQIDLRKIRFIIFELQPTYSILLRYAASLDNNICCIINSDIEIVTTKDSIRLFSDLLMNKMASLFIKRHERDGTKPFIQNYCGSHDAFIFYAPQLRKINTDFEELNYVQNTNGIEALLILFFARKFKFELYNPCLQIKLIHHHTSNIRSWLTEGTTAVGYVSPIKLDMPGIHCDSLVQPLYLTPEN